MTYNAKKYGEKRADKGGERMDKRVQRTRQIIKSTVAKLLITKKIDEISVTEISAQSLIQRATFYNNYSSVYEVVMDIRNEITAVAAEKFEDVDFSAVRRSAEVIFRRISEFYQALPDAYRKFLASDNVYLSNGVRKWFFDNLINKIEKSQRKLSEFERYSVKMFINGIIDAYFEWKKSGSPTAPRDINEFASFAFRTLDCACNFIGIE